VTFFYFENYDQVETVLFLLHSFDALRRFKSHFGPREVWIKVGGFVIRVRVYPNFPRLDWHKIKVYLTNRPRGR
jgi:hypothetical protein